MLACIYMEKNSLAAMLATKRLVGLTPEANLTENLTHTPLTSVNETLKARGDIIRSVKQGYQCPRKRT